VTGLRWAVRDVTTPQGVARLHRAGRSIGGRSTVVLGHGAGGGIEAVDLQAISTAIIGSGRAVVLVEQPWRVAGRRIAPRPAALDEAWIAAVGALRPRGPLVVGGRSAGARVACRTAVAVGAAAVIAIAFPLHPPGRPDRSRADELAACAVPVVVLQGDRDPFGGAREVARAARRVQVVPILGGDHGLSRAPLTDAVARLVAILGRWDGTGE
jgi:predicted alpha/beta-hydrolase family hydrolase